MNTRTRGLIISGVVLCLAYPGFAWLIGMQVEASILKREQQAVALYPGTVRLVSRQYHRGVYGATEDLTYGFNAAAARALAALAGSADPLEMQITVHNTIHHGPLPQFRTFAPATIDSTVELPAALSAKLHSLLGALPTLDTHARLGWFGRMTSRVSSPGFQGKLPDGTTFGWRDLKFSSSASADWSSTQLDGTVAALTLKSEKVQGELDGLAFSIDWKRAFEVLYTGPFSLKTANVKWQSLTGPSQGLLQGFSIKGSSAAEGDFYKSDVEIAADVLQVPGYAVSHATYGLSFDHLYAPSLAALMQGRRTVANSLSTNPAAAGTAAFESITKNALDLVLHEPVMSIPTIAFTMPEGDLKFSASASVPGMKREDIEGPQLQAALMQHLSVVADLRVDTALLTKLLAGSARGDAMAGQIQTLTQQGYLKPDGKAVTSHLTFAAGKFTVNGQPYPPGPAH